MRFSIASTLALIGLLGATSTAQTVPSSQCHPKGAVHAIIVRGESLPGDGDPSPINVLVTTKAEIEKQMPGSSVIGLPYDYFNSDKFAAINSGSRMLKDYVAKYVASCPDARIMVVGYSLVSFQTFFQPRLATDDVRVEWSLWILPAVHRLPASCQPFSLTKSTPRTVSLAITVLLATH